MKNTKIQVSNITYDLDGLAGFNEYSNGKSREDVLADVPQQVLLTLNDESSLVGEGGSVDSFMLRNYLENEAGWQVIDFTLKVLDEQGESNEKVVKFQKLKDKLSSLMSTSAGV